MEMKKKTESKGIHGKTLCGREIFIQFDASGNHGLLILTVSSDLWSIFCHEVKLNNKSDKKDHFKTKCHREVTTGDNFI